ncbi:hypothetical protein ACOJBO_10335 [Rhizobium beringeri]
MALQFDLARCTFRVAGHLLGDDLADFDFANSRELETGLRREAVF